MLKKQTSHSADPIHSLSRAQANRYGVNGAILLSYMINRIKSSQNVREGRRWFYSSVADLAKNYKYLSQTAIFNARNTLTADNGPIIKGNFNRRRGDKTTWYSVHDERTLQVPEDDVLYFRVSDAVDYGVLEAILLQNLRYWLHEKQKGQPNCRFHAMSTRRLEEVFAGIFGRSTIQDALKNLVSKGVLIPNAPTKANDPIAYGFACSEDEVVNLEGGQIEIDPDQNVNNTEVAENSCRDQNLNLAGRTENEPGQNTNEVAGIKAKVAGMRVTLPINNSLKDCLLKDCLKEDHFKASSVGDSSRTHFDAAPLNGSLLDVVMGHNDFSESIVCPATFCPASVSTNDMPENFAVAPIKSRKQPFDDFLDKTVHDRCWAVMKEHADSRDGVLHEMADAINYAAKKLISNTPPAQIYRFRCAKKQGELDGLLHTWSRRFFEEAYDNEMSNPEIPGNDNFRELFLTHGSCFLTMAITHLIFPDSPIYAGVPQLYDIQIAALCRLNPWLEEQQAQRRDQIMQERRTTFASPDHDKEADPNISAPEKVQVLRQSLQARNRIGKIDQSGVLKEMVVEVTQNTPNLAREFFQLNPHYTVQHINQVIDACVNLPCDCADETDPLWHARKGYKISLLLSCFTQVVTQLNMLSRLPAFTPLAVEEER